MTPPYKIITYMLYVVGRSTHEYIRQETNSLKEFSRLNINVIIVTALWASYHPYLFTQSR